jgi:hypothetical protein
MASFKEKSGEPEPGISGPGHGHGATAPGSGRMRAARLQQSFV